MDSLRTMRRFDKIHSSRGTAIGAVVALTVGGACSHDRALDAIERQLSVNNAGASAKASGHDSGAGAAGAGGGAELEPGPAIVPIAAPVLTVTTTDFTHYDEHDRSLAPDTIVVSDQAFAFARRFPQGSGDGKNAGSAGYFGQTHDAIEKGDLLRAFFWARCVIPRAGRDLCQSGLVYEQAAHPYENGGLEFGFNADREWKAYSEVFVSARSYGPGEVQLTFRLGYPDQQLEIGAIGLESYGKVLGLVQAEAMEQAAAPEVLSADSFAHYGAALREDVVGIDLPFGKATRFSTNGLTFGAPEESGYQTRNSRPVREQDWVLLTFWARCVSSLQADGSCISSAVFEEVQSPYINAGLESPSIAISSRWQGYRIPFRVLRDYDVDRVKVGFRLGYSDQTLEFGWVTLRHFGNQAPIVEAPQLQAL